ncbi:hypothetical protein [Methylosinus trichosporium]|uniref:hypothetical protein n=1 Tax=Methylosinus trichosporium TaxID=426 RepID=UPI001FCE4BE1|nr:hypothetical protein [Methylosinus trichosporium]
MQLLHVEPLHDWGVGTIAGDQPQAPSRAQQMEIAPPRVVALCYGVGCGGDATRNVSDRDGRYMAYAFSNGAHPQAEVDIHEIIDVEFGIETAYA